MHLFANLKSIALMTSFFLLSCSTARLQKEAADQQQREPAAKHEDPTYDDLEKIILNEKPKTISKLLGSLSRDYPKYLTHHTLAYNSLSIHGSNYQNPRAIVFGESGNLIISFNGDSAQRAYANLEVMSFDIVNGFQFKEILFRQEPHAETQLELSEMKIQNEVVQISKANPTLCMECHGQTIARPIWQPYFNWHGMYGSNDDMLYQSGTMYAQEKPSSIRRSMTLKGKDHELDGYLEYQKYRTSNERYKYLPARAIGISLQDSYYADRPNFSLLTVLSIQRDRLIFRDLKKHAPTHANLQTLMNVLCYQQGINDPAKDEVAPPSSVPELRPLLKQRKLLKAQFDKDEREQFAEDMGFMQQDFKNTLVDVKDEIAQNQSVDGASSDDLVALALKKNGLNLQDYSLGLRRTNVYSLNGSANFPTLKALLVREFKKQKWAIPEQCEEDPEL